MRAKSSGILQAVRQKRRRLPIVLVLVVLPALLLSAEEAAKPKYPLPAPATLGGYRSEIHKPIAFPKASFMAAGDEATYDAFMNMTVRLAYVCASLRGGYGFAEGFTSGLVTQASWEVTLSPWQNPYVRSGWEWTKQIGKVVGLAASAGALSWSAIDEDSDSRTTNAVAAIGLIVSAVFAGMDAIDAKKSELSTATGGIVQTGAAAMKTAAAVYSDLSRSRVAYDMTMTRLQAAVSLKQSLGEASGRVKGFEDEIAGYLNNYNSDRLLFIKANALGTYTGRLLVIVKSLIDECESYRQEARSFLSCIEEYGKSYEYLKSTNPPLSKAVADNLDKAGAQAVKALQEFKSYQPTVVDSPDLHEYFLLQVRDQLSPAVDALKDT